jgi:D-aspartate ligase
MDSNSQERSVDYLGKIASIIGSPAVLVPTSDDGVLFIAANATALSEWFLFSKNSSNVIQRLINKREFHFLARSVGMHTPGAFFPNSKQSAVTHAREAVYPLILKNVAGYGAQNGPSYCNLIVRTENEFLAACEFMDAPDWPNLMIQEYIPDGTRQSWMFNGYFNSQSECLFGSTGKKIRQYPPHVGITSLGSCLPNDEIIETTLRFIGAMGYVGIVDIDYIFDARDRLYKILDVNPRVGCTFRLFVSDTEMDVVRALYFDLTGQAIEAGQSLYNRKWIAEPADLASFVRSWRAGELKLTEWVRSFQGLGEGAYFAVDDPYPMVAVCGNYFRAAARKAGLARVEPALARSTRSSLSKPPGVQSKGRPQRGRGRFG